MPQHIRIASKLGEVRLLIQKIEEQLQHPELDAKKRDEWLDNLLDFEGYGERADRHV